MEARLRDPRRRARPRALHGGPAADLRPPGTRRRVRHAQPALREAAPTLVPLLRQPPDRPADVARDRRPAERALLPRLRPHLLLPARADGRRGDHGDARRRLEARARRLRDHAGADPARVSVLARLASGPAGRPAEDGRHDDRRRGEHRRRPRRQVVRAGVERAGEVLGALEPRLRTQHGREHAARDLRPAPLLPAARRAGRRDPRRRPHGRQRPAQPDRLLLLQRPRPDARVPAPDARDVDRPGAARDRVGRAHLRGARRDRGRRATSPAPSTSRRARDA